MRRASASGTLLAACTVLLSATGAGGTGPTYTRVSTPGTFGRFTEILAVADFDGDGREDFLGGVTDRLHTGARSDRLVRTPVFLFLSQGNGAFRSAAAEMVAGEMLARTPVPVVADFNRDGRPDVALFDAGVYETTPATRGFGNPPVLFLSGPDRKLHPSPALADAVLAVHAGGPFAGSADVHLKSATAGDIDGDGDLDIWVESCGGNNVCSHFMINNGNDTFTADVNRVPNEVLHNPPPEFWRHVSSALVDLNGDRFLDLVLGQIRDLDPTHINQASLVVFNDGTGRFPLGNRVLLPRPAFNDGVTSADSIAALDLDADGRLDLVLAHQRNDDGPPGIEPWTGRFVQVVVNRGSGVFVDETATRMGDQSATTAERSAIYGDLLHNSVGALRAADVDGDRDLDLVMGRSWRPVGREAPLVHLNDGSGRFTVLDPNVITGGELYFAESSWPIELNGDGVLDFVHPDSLPGPDGVYGTDDDLTRLIALVGRLAVTIGDASVAEGDSGTTTMTFTISLSQPTSLTATVNYAVTGATATAGTDFIASQGTLSFPPGITTRTISAPVIGDRLNEANETLFVNLSAPVNATLDDSEGVGTIVDDDPPGLAISDAAIAEPRGGTANAIFTVTLSPAGLGTTAVGFATVDGSAGAPADYAATAGTLTFLAGETSQTVSVPVRADTVPEAAEIFSVDLQGSSGPTITRSRGTATIYEAGFYPVSPCRVLDTRGEGHGPALSAGSTRTVVVSGRCGVPPGASAVSLNVTVVSPTGPGDLRLFPARAGLALVSAINYGVGQTRANNATVALSTDGMLSVFCEQAAGVVDLVADVNGYFE